MAKKFKEDVLRREKIKKVTSIGSSPLTRYNSKKDKLSKKAYRGQGRVS